MITTSVGIEVPSALYSHGDSDGNGCVFPIDIYKRKMTYLGGALSGVKRDFIYGNFVHIPRVSIESFFSSNGEFSYIGEFSLFSASTPGGRFVGDFCLNPQSGFVRVLREGGNYYTVIGSDRALDYGTFAAWRLLGMYDDNMKYTRTTTPLLVSARRDFLVEPLQVPSFKRSSGIHIEDLGKASKKDIAQLAKSVTEPHPEEKRIMDFYRSRLFEPLIHAEPGHGSIIEYSLLWSVRDLPSNLKGLDFLHHLHTARNI